MQSVVHTQIVERSHAIRSLSSAVEERKIGVRLRAGVALVPVIRASVLNSLVRAIGATVYQVGNELAVTRALPNATLVPVPPLCVVGGAVQSASAVLMHTDPWLLVLSVAGALVLLARSSRLEAH